MRLARSHFRVSISRVEVRVTFAEQHLLQRRHAPILESAEAPVLAEGLVSDLLPSTMGTKYQALAMD